MLNVSNRKCVRRLGWRSLKASRTRNLIAILAIALTTMLFTSLFTIALSINEGFQQSTFRQVGGDFHGSFKDVTEAQMAELKSDPLIRESGGRLFLGLASGPPFEKVQVEVSYMDDFCAKHYFITPEEGRYPQNPGEILTDTRVLGVLGVKPELGAEIRLPFYIDGNTASPKRIDRTYTLCGWWTTDEAGPASFVNLSRTEAEEIAALSSGDEKSNTGKWALNVMFSNSFSIEENMTKVLAQHGYQNEGLSAGDNYISTGVNWGYIGATIKLDAGTVPAFTAVMALIIFTGYLIIYNVFQISVANDIRFYGLLKTIGTTGKQLRRIIGRQALILSAAGIPLGLILGWLAGVVLTPVIVARLNGVVTIASANPFIFLSSAAFALFTVLLSCHKPGKLAAKVSPVEAVRYTEGGTVRKRRKKSGKPSLTAMAWANLGRSRGRTILTILSLSLAVMLLNLTVTFTNGFDMSKYISNFVATDFIVGDNGFFHSGNTLWGEDNALPEPSIERIVAQGGIAGGGRTYGKDFYAQEFIGEDYYRRQKGRYMSQEILDQTIAQMDRQSDGKLADQVQLYGMEPFCLDKLHVLEGDISKLYEPGKQYIAAVYREDETGNIDLDSQWAKLGEKVSIRYVDKFEIYDPATGEAYPEGMDLSNVRWIERAVSYTDVEYEVAALVSVPTPLSYRYYGKDEFVLNAQDMLRDSGSRGSPLYFAFDTADAASNDHMEAFLKDYTEYAAPELGYESRATYETEFYAIRSMFLLMGGALSFIVGLVGVLNFLNAILTSIAARRRELAMLQSMGMTGKQLKKMLAIEGLLYTAGSLLICTVLNLMLAPVVKSAVEGMFWFFSYHFTVWPILLVMPVFVLLGAGLPLIVYRFAIRKSIVERLKETA